MRKLLLLLPIIGMLIVACGGGAKSPSDVALAYNQALANKDFDGAKKYCTEETKKVVDMMKGLVSMGGDKKEDKKMTFSKVSEKIDGDKAVVRLKVNDGKETKEEDVTLKKVSGKWLVAMDKNSPKQDDTKKPE